MLLLSLFGIIFDHPQRGQLVIMSSRKPRDYDGIEVTTRPLGSLLPVVLGQIANCYHEEVEFIFATWNHVIGDSLASMTTPFAFREGVLHVKVKNSTLLSLLSHYNKQKLLESIRSKCPRVTIRDIKFRIG